MESAAEQEGAASACSEQFEHGNSAEQSSSEAAKAAIGTPEDAEQNYFEAHTDEQAYYMEHAAAHCATQLTHSQQQARLTFSGPPHVPTAKPYHRVDYSHSKVKLMKISLDNQKLVQRLTSISHKEPSWAKELGTTARCNVASSAVNRRKAAATIAQENHALYQRLVAIKPSKDISKETLEAEHRRNETYRVNCARYKTEGPQPEA